MKKNLSETRKFGGKIDALGFHCPRWSKCLQKVCGTINSIKVYCRMFLREKLQQDNAPAHNSILSKTWFSENGLEILEKWPPNSSDINIIENVLESAKEKSFPKISQ